MIYVLSGSTSLYAVIAVTYPAGSICTCGGKKAKDTSGYALFPVKAGTYTVECHTSNGSQSKSTSVTVADSDAGKVITVELSYGLFLFKAGTGLLTGYSVQKLTSAGNFNNTDYIEWATTSQTDAGNLFQFQPAVDFSVYKTLHVDLECTGRYSSSQTAVVVAITEKFRTGESASTWDTLSKISAKTDSYNKTRHTVSIDISAISSRSYVTINAFGISGKLHNLWLE